MPAQDTLHARNTLHTLITQPLRVLDSHTVFVEGLVGNDTRSAPLFVGAYQDELRISPDRLVAATFMNTGRPVNVPDAVVRCTGLASPMRAHIASDPHRLNATAQVQPGDNKLWVTEQQTGCSVLILKWPTGACSMVHLQPNADSEFNRLGNYINRSDIGLAIQKNAWLKPELTQVANLSGNGTSPESYILVQSLHTARRRNACQVIGVNANGRFDFYLQNSVYSGMTETRSTQLMRWTPWISYVPYLSY